MIDWAMVNVAHPKAVAFAIDEVGQAWLFGEVPRYLANRWCVSQHAWKMPLGLINPVPSNAAGSLIIRDDMNPTGWQAQGPEPLKPGEKPKQVEPVHARGWATSDPAPQGMHIISEAEATGAQVNVQRNVIPGVLINPVVKPPNVSVVNPAAPATAWPKAQTNLILTKVVLELVEGLPPGKRREQLLEILNNAG